MLQLCIPPRIKIRGILLGFYVISRAIIPPLSSVFGLSLTRTRFSSVSSACVSWSTRSSCQYGELCRMLRMRAPFLRRAFRAAGSDGGKFMFFCLLRSSPSDGEMQLLEEMEVNETGSSPADHPRVYGENAQIAGRTAAATGPGSGSFPRHRENEHLLTKYSWAFGSSPRIRGKRAQDCNLDRELWIIPEETGETDSRAGGTR